MKLSNFEKIGGAFIFMATAVFSLLNLCGIITLPWVYVLSPIWVPVVIYIIGTILILILQKCFDR